MGQPARISAKSIKSDIRSNLSASDLMKKYGLSTKGLETVFSQLMAAGLVDMAEISERYPSYAPLLKARTMNKGTVLTLSVPVPISDLEGSAKGILRDISLEEIRVAGVNAKVGEIRNFRIPVDMFMAAEPLELATRCTWVKTKGREKKYAVAGFEMVNLTKSQRETLERFMKVMFLSSSGEWRVADR
jgi:hypothetical protein